MIDQFLRFDVHARLEFDKGKRCLAPFRVGLGNHRAGHDRRVSIQRIFNLDRRNIFPARNNDVFGPVFKLHITAVVNHAEIARVKPASCKCLVCRISVFQVALHDDIAAKHHLAHALAIFRNPLHGFWIHDGQPSLQGITNPLASISLGPLTKAQFGPIVLLGTNRCRSVNLGEPINMGEVKAHRLHTCDHRRWGRCACDHARNPMMDTRSKTFRRVNQHGMNNRGSTVVAHPMLADELENQGSVDLAKTNIDPCKRCNRPGETPAIAMKHRQGPQVDRMSGYGPS